MNLPRNRPWALTIIVVLTYGCGSVVEEPAGTSSDSTSMSTGSGGAGTTGTTSSGVGGQCVDGPPDPVCGCVGWELAVQCGCDCGGVMVDFWDYQYQWPDCHGVPVEHACPDGGGGAGGAPAFLDCEVLGTSKVCGP